MCIPLQFASLYDGQAVFVWSNCLLGLGTDFLVGNMVFVRDAWYLAVAPHCAKEQAGFRAGRSTTEQVFDLRILCKKYLQHQQDLYHVFIDFKKAFERVWHATLWAPTKKYNTSTNLIRVIKDLCDKATSAVLFNSSIGDWFRTIVGV